MSAPGAVRAAQDAAHERRLAELRAVSPKVADAAERCLRAVRAAQEAGRVPPERLIRVNIGFTCPASTADLVAGLAADHGAADIVERRYLIDESGRPVNLPAGEVAR